MLEELSVQDQAVHAHTGSWVAGILRKHIANGQLTPGTQLSEQALATTLGVSRNTLREAFAVLAAESIVKRIPNRGVFVVSPGAEEIREIYRVRRAIESSALLWGRPSAQDLDHMDGIITQARGAREAGDITAMADANQEFHKAIVALTDSPTLAKLMERVLAEMRLVFHSMASIPDFHSHYVERNAELIHLLHSGQSSEAVERLKNYLDAAEAELLGLDRG